MTPPAAERSRRVLAIQILGGDGSSTKSLRVYCEVLQRSLPLEVCKGCNSFRSVAPDPSGGEVVRCLPDCATASTSDSSVGRALRHGVLAVRADASLGEVVALLADSGAPLGAVVDAEGKTIGVIHQSRVLDEIRAHLAPSTLRRAAIASLSLDEPRAEEVMSLISPVPESTPLRRALTDMASSHNRFVVVVDAQNQPIGVLGDVDGLHALFQSR